MLNLYLYYLFALYDRCNQCETLQFETRYNLAMGIFAAVDLGIKKIHIFVVWRKQWNNEKMHGMIVKTVYSQWEK